jgi:hypothetical protein
MSFFLKQNGGVYPRQRQYFLSTGETIPQYGRNDGKHARPGKQLMMMRIDVAVDDLAQAVAAAQELGATRAGFQPQDNCTVLPDPAGHPFCLYVDA